MTFKEYIQYKNPICSVRSIFAIVRYNLQGNDTYESLIQWDAISKKTALDILNLQRKYKKHI